MLCCYFLWDKCLKYLNQKHLEAARELRKPKTYATRIYAGICQPGLTGNCTDVSRSRQKNQTAELEGTVEISR